MTRLLCRLGLHRWREPTMWIPYTSNGRRHVRGISRCASRTCPAQRTYAKSWAPKTRRVGRG